MFNFCPMSSYVDSKCSTPQTSSSSYSALRHCLLKRGLKMSLDVSDWLRTPAPFNLKKHGRRAIFSSDNSIVERREPEMKYSECVCYTSRPLPPGQVWEITILNTISGCTYDGLVSGCVLYLLYHLFMSVLVHYQ